jgi:hypothetical protein
MVSIEEIVKKVLDFSEKEFIDNDPALLSSRGSNLLDMDYMGIAINGPNKILCDQQGSIPIIMGIRVSGERDWDVNLIKNCFVVATNLTTGELIIAHALVGSKDRGLFENRSSVKEPAPPGLAIAAAQLVAIDVRKQISIPWNSGFYSLNMLYYDWLSNTIQLQLVGEEVLPNPHQATQVNPEPNLADISSFPCYVPTSNSLESPEKGAVFTIEFFETSHTPQLAILGAFALEARVSHIAWPDLVHTLQNGTQYPVCAIIPVTLLMLTLDAKEPVKIDWKIPVYGSECSVGMLVKGSFSIEVLSAENIKELNAGEYVCYIEIDGQIYGPQTFQVPEKG